MAKWRAEDVLKIFEGLLEQDCPVHTHPNFRKGFSRDQNLFVNQVIRKSTANVAYRSVDFDLVGVSDEQFWQRMDRAKYTDLIEENAAAAMVKMAERFGIV